MKGAYATLVKRELWEHRWLWIAPLIAVGLLTCVTAFAATRWSTLGIAQVPSSLRTEIAGMERGLFNFAAQVFAVYIIVMAIYLLDCLYSERKDRSILFWKSLPVSDFQTVITKFGVGLILLPIATFALTTIFYPVNYAVGTIVWPGSVELTGGWSTGDWLRAEVGLLGSVIATILWYAPLGAWFMLTSVLANRSPYLFVGIPVVVLGVVGSRLLQTNDVWRFFLLRMKPVESFSQGIQQPGLWIGLAVAAGMLYIVVRLRRYRDDT